MSQERSVQIRYEQEAKERKNERTDAAMDRTVHDRMLHFEPQDPIEAINDRTASDFLLDFTNDEIRRILIVARGSKLKAGGFYVDLRDRRRGELIATGQEVVGDELLVAKRDVDHVIWDKLVVSSDFEPAIADRDGRNPPDPFPAGENAPPSATFH